MSGKKQKKAKAKAAAKGKARPAKPVAKAKSSSARARGKVPASSAKKTAARTSRPSAKTAPKSASQPKVKTPARPQKSAPAKTITPPAPSGPRFPIKTPARPAPLPAQKTSQRPRTLSPKFLEKQRKNLLDLRDHILDQMQGVAQDSLKSDGNAPSSAFGMHQADAGSDAYEKDFALSLLSQEQDALYEIEEALKRIELGTYGICEMSGEPIPTERLEAIPFARYTVQCQQQIERENRGKNRWDTTPQFMETAENFFEEEEESEEDTQKLKE